MSETISDGRNILVKSSTYLRDISIKNYDLTTAAVKVNSDRDWFAAEGSCINNNTENISPAEWGREKRQGKILQKENAFERSSSFIK